MLVINLSSPNIPFFYILLGDSGANYIFHLQAGFLCSSVQSLICVRLCNHMGCSTPGLPVHDQLPELSWFLVRLYQYWKAERGNILPSLCMILPISTEPAKMLYQFLSPASFGISMTDWSCPFEIAAAARNAHSSEV